MATIRSWSRHSFAGAAGDKAADLVFERLQQRIAEAPQEWSLDYVEHHQMMERVQRMSRLNNAAPAVSVREHVSDHLSVFVVAEDTDDSRPANGGLRLLNYPSDEACIADGQRLAGLMTHKHDLYGTGFAGGKIVARADDPNAVKAELISITARLLESLEGTMITGCDLNTSLEDMERLNALTPHVLAAVGSNVDASAATAHGTLGAVEAVLGAELTHAQPGRALVHGCGAVGSTVARTLVAHDWTVFTVDSTMDAH